MVSYSLINIPKDLWEKFKDITPRKISLDKAIIELIREKVNNAKIQA